MNIFFYHTSSVKGTVTRKSNNYKRVIFKVNLLITSRKVCITKETELKNVTSLTRSSFSNFELKNKYSQLTTSLRFIIKGKNYL